MISFTKVRLAFGWLGNMSPHPVTYRGKVFRTTEHLFQVLRFAWDDPIVEMIIAQSSPMSAKMAAKGSVQKMIVVPQSEQDLDNMRLCLRLKVEAHPNLRDQLLATGDEEIVEDCSNRQRGSGLFWGMGLQGDGTWKGENILGKLWMELRTELRAVDK